MTVKFKSPTVKSITIAGRTYKESELTPSLYRRFINLSPALADQFELVNESAEESQPTNESEDGNEKKQSNRKRSGNAGSVHTEGQ